MASDLLDRYRNELRRLYRTIVQALVTALVLWLGSKGIELDVDGVMVVVWPLAMFLVTALVRWAADNVPVVGRFIGWLNGGGTSPIYDPELPSNP